MNAFDIALKTGNLIIALDLLDNAYANLWAAGADIKFKLTISEESEINSGISKSPMVIQCDFQALLYRLQPFHFTYGDIRKLINDGIFTMAGETNYLFHLHVIGDKFDI